MEERLRGMCSPQGVIHKAFSAAATAAAAAGVCESQRYFCGAWWDAGLVAQG